ncbi:flagellar biosynthesis protein FlhB [Salinisphaera aquimarina]|uniref:Flagellar biosynthetic protein FlhB n=1 Tax=Salinisphaera aquimarina TaxID=2094031 RepID=A0ABV7EQM1_9GAMM
MAEDSDEEKTEPATPRRLEKAREEGQVPRSRELATLMLLCTGLGGLYMLSGWTGRLLSEVMRMSLDFDAGAAMDTSRMLARLWIQATLALQALAPLLGALAVVALLAPTLLGGWLFSAKSIKVDLKRLDLFKGLGRLFSSQSVAELVKAIAKSVLVGAVAASFIYAHMHELLALAGEPSRGALLHALELVVACCALMLLAFVIVVLIDVPYQLWSHHKKLRMSRDEIKKEHKETEGDPQLKGRIRQQQQAMARKRMMSEIPKANVVVTNPTHFAVALAYRDGEMSAPKVVAKGADHVAARIRELAAEHGVPQLAAPPLARALYRHAELEAEIPAVLYTAVAEVLAWVFQLERHQNGSADRPAPPQDIEVPPELDTALNTESAE